MVEEVLVDDVLLAIRDKQDQIEEYKVAEDLMEQIIHFGIIPILRNASWSPRLIRRGVHRHCPAKVLDSGRPQLCKVKVRFIVRSISA